MPKKIFIVSLHTLLILASISFNYASATQRSARIIGGRPASSNAWPWMSGLVYKYDPISNGLFCGASLIAKDWILTAAHCVFNESNASFDVIINQPQLDSYTSERLAVDSIIIHPEYNDFTLDNDLALIKLATPSRTQPIQALPPFTAQDNAGKLAIAIGWGAISTSPEEYPLDLYQVDLPIIDTPLCDAAMGDITADMLCAGNGLGYKDTCFGDSGGPLVVFDTESQSWRQAGITSWGFGCADPGSYGVYTRLKNYAAFISDHICAAHELAVSTSLQLKIEDNKVRASWGSSNNAYLYGYRLNYAPYPDAQTIYSIDMNRSTDLSVTLGSGSAYYVAISSYHNNCISEYSNIEHFIIK